MQLTFAANAAYLRYEALLKELHELNVVGKLDSKEADSIRDQMELPWESLTEAEQRRLSGLSADLYSFTNEEIIQTDDQATSAILLQQLRSTFERKDWDGLLVALRSAQRLVPAPQVAYMRGRCWSELGHDAPAFWFFEQARTLDPTRNSFSILALDALFKMGRRDEALSRARVLLDEPGSHPHLVFGAAKVLFDSAGFLPESEAAPLYQAIVDAISKALTEDAKLPATELSSLTMAALLNRALALDRLGKESDAREAYDELIVRFPRSDSALMARALFLVGRDGAQASRDLQLLVDQGTSLSYPYFFLAHEALVHRDFALCARLCSNGIERSGPSMVTASLLEWLAIANSELQAPAEVVRAHFDRALSLDPFNERIAANLRSFENYTNTAATELSFDTHFDAATMTQAAQQSLNEPTLFGA